MKRIKLWNITSNDKAQPVAKEVPDVDQTDTESLLEEVLVHSPDLLGEDLRLVGRQTDTPGGPLDLLGVDADGNLVVFELKRGALTRDAVSQIIDYASFIAELDPLELSKHISEQSGKHGIEKIPDFLNWYQEQFAKNLSDLNKPRMVLVGLGVDDRARRMVSYLADSDIDISLITFHAFKENGNVLLAKQVEVETKIPTDQKRTTKKDNLIKLTQKISKLGIGEYYYRIAEFFRKQLNGYEWPNQSGFSYYLPDLTESGSESNRMYIALYLHDTHPNVHIHFHQRAIEAAAAEYDSLKKKLGKKMHSKNDKSAQIYVDSLSEWIELEPILKEFSSAVYEGWKKKREQMSTKEIEEIEHNSSDETKID